MKTRTEIIELSQEDLVNLLCTATYVSMWLSCHAPDCVGVDITEEDCLEDVWAKCLLHGNKIIATDHYAESCVYGENEDFNICEDGDVEYAIGLNDIINGLQKCADGTFTANSEGERSYMRSCLKAFMDDEGDMDNPMAENLMQIIIFGELIYG